MNIISNFKTRKESKFSLTNINDINTIPNDRVLHCYDSFLPVTLRNIYTTLGRPAAVINDHYVTFDLKEFGANVFAVPAWAAEEARKYFKDDCNRNLDTKHNAYIACNNKRINRYLGLKLAEWFQVNFFYTWSGSGANFDMTDILQELEESQWQSWMSEQARSFLLAPITLTPRWINAGNDLPVIDKSSDRVTWDPQIDNYHSTGYNWRHATKIPHSQSAVILITEAVMHQRAAVITEKTIQPILAASFPLWVGGYGQADAMQQIGFDVFSDIIDHSYQYMPTLIERCWFAYKLNSRLLSDLEFAANQRHKAKDRLFDNQDRLLNGVIDKYCVQTINSWSDPARTAASLLFEWQFGLPLTATLQ